MKDQKREIEFLLGELFSFAKEMLENYGEFEPFGGFLNEFREMVHLGVESEETFPIGSVQLKRVEAALSEAAPDAIACGAVANMSITGSDGDVHDAVVFFLEHREGYCAKVFYRFELADGLPVFHTPFAERADHKFFGGQP